MGLESQLPQSRLGRLAKFGRLAGGIASGALSEGARQLSQGQKPSMRSVLLSAGNATRLTDRLSEMVSFLQPCVDRLVARPMIQARGVLTP